MQQHEFKPPKKARKKRRIGRGDSSGYGSFAGKGMKGQKSRSGGGVRLGFQGGGLALIKSLPMLRGFTNIFRIEYTLVNVDTLARFAADSEITPESLVEAGAIKDTKRPIKVLGRGELGVPLSVQAHKFSKSARVKIEAAGGSVREIG